MKRNPVQVVEDSINGIPELTNKVFPAHVPEIEAPFPCAVYTFEGDTLVDSLRGDTLGMRRHLSFEVTIMAPSVQQAFTLAEKVTAALDATGRSDPAEYSGPLLEIIGVDPNAPGGLAELVAYSCVMSYAILY